MRVILTILLIFAVTTLSAQTDKMAAQKRIIENLEKQVSAGEKQVATLRKERATKEQQVENYATQINNRNILLDAQTKQVELLKAEIAQNDTTYKGLNAELDKQREMYAEIVCEAYRNYRNNDLMSYLFTSESFTDVARKIVNLRAISQIREQKMTHIETLATSVVEHRALLVSQKEELDATVAKLESQRSSLERDLVLARSSIKSMSSREKKLLQDRELQKRKLDSAISELRKLVQANKAGASFTAATTNLNLPVVGGRVKRYMDNMAEIVGATNAKVNSIYEGKVVDIKHNRITGKYDVYIAHGGYITSYAGLASVSVAKDSNVTKNQNIGVIGQAVDILTMQTEYKIVFGIYPPNPAQKMKAADCFKK